jgi:hypothetical protein
VRFSAFFLLCFACFAGNAEFNGRWDIKAINEPRGRVWWLEISGAGSGGPLQGKFVSALHGDMNVIHNLAIQNGELSFSFVNEQGQKLAYRARIEGGQLKGAFEGPGGTLEFAGTRAPVINDKDDGSWKSGKTVKLFNGKDLSGWNRMIPGKETGWVVKDGLLANIPPANNLISTQKFWNFELHAEFRLREHSNSGIGLRGRYEIQIQDDYGKPCDSHCNGALYSRIAPSVNASRKPGEWQAMDVRLIGRTLTVRLNEQKILDQVEVEGLTAMAHDADEALPGPITVQGDHREVEFRSLTVTPLTR